MNLSFAAIDQAMQRMYNESTVAEWEALSTEPYKNNAGEWNSVYRSKAVCTPFITLEIEMCPMTKLADPSRQKLLSEDNTQEGSDGTKWLQNKQLKFVALGVTLQAQQ